MNFAGAMTSGWCDELHGLPARNALIYRDLVNQQLPSDALLKAPGRYLGCEFTPESLGDFEEYFEIYRPVRAKGFAVSKVHQVKPAGSFLPAIDVGFFFDLPLSDTGLSKAQVEQDLTSAGVDLADAVTLFWISADPDQFFPLENWRKKVLLPK